MKYTLIVLFFLIGCATGAYTLRLQDKTLLIDSLTNNLIYPTYIEKCKYPDRRVFRFCESVRHIEVYDLDDLETRKELINLGFTCTSSQRFKY